MRVAHDPSICLHATCIYSLISALMSKRSKLGVTSKSKYDAIATALANKSVDFEIYQSIAAHTPLQVSEAPEGVMTRRSSRTHQRPLLDMFSTDILECIFETLLCNAETFHDPWKRKISPAAIEKTRPNQSMRTVAVVVNNMRQIDDRRNCLKGLLSLCATCRHLYSLSQRSGRRMYAMAMTDPFDATHPKSFLRETALMRVFERAQFDTWVQMLRRKALHCANPCCWCFNKRSDCLDKWRDISNVCPGMFAEFEANMHNNTPLYIDCNRVGTHVLCDINESLWEMGLLKIDKASVSQRIGKRRKVIKLPAVFVKNACALHVSACNRWLLSCAYTNTAVHESVAQLVDGMFPSTPFFINELRLAHLEHDRVTLDSPLLEKAQTTINNAFVEALQQVRANYKKFLRALYNLTEEGYAQQRSILERAMQDTAVNEAMQYCNASLSELPETAHREAQLQLTVCVRPDYWTGIDQHAVYRAHPHVHGMNFIRIRYGLRSNTTTLSVSNEMGCDLCRSPTFAKSCQIDFDDVDGTCCLSTTFQQAQFTSAAGTDAAWNDSLPMGEYLVLKVLLPPLDETDSSMEIYSFLCKNIPVRQPDRANSTELVIGKIMWVSRPRREMCVFVLVCKNTPSGSNELCAYRLLLNTFDMSITTLDTYKLEPFVPHVADGIEIDAEGLQVSVAPSGERVLITVAAEETAEDGETHEANETGHDDNMTRMYGWMLDYGRERKVIKSFYPQCKNYHNLAWHQNGLSSTLQGGSLLFDMPPTKTCCERAFAKQN